MPLSTISNGATSASARAAINAAINALNFAAATGTRITGYWTSAPSGYVLANGATIGNAASGASGRANADTADLFALLWGLPTMAVIEGRGISASADFAANKRITTPDERLRVAAMVYPGSALAGLDSVLGNTGGSETHTLVGAEIPIHTHEIINVTQALTATLSPGHEEYGVTVTTGESSGPAGDGQAHNNVQPFIFVNVAIKL